MTDPRFQPFQVTLLSSPVDVRSALQKILSNLETLDTDEANAVELVLAEVLNNIVEHAYPNAERAGVISVECSRRPDGLLFKFIDRGVFMPGGQPPIGTLTEDGVPKADLPEGGFGWFIIRHLAKDLIYKRKDNENHLSLRLAVGIA